MTTEFKKDDFFKIDPECHLIPDIHLLEHFPGVKMWWGAVPNILRALNMGLPEGDLPFEDWELKHVPNPRTSSEQWISRCGHCLFVARINDGHNGIHDPMGNKW